MNDWFNEQESDYYFLKSHGIYTEGKDKVKRPQYSFVSETSDFSYSTFATPAIDYENLDFQTVKALLDIGLEGDSLIPDHHTYLVLDISQYKETPYNSLLLQLNGAPLKSFEPTLKVMTSFFEHMKVPYPHMRKFGEALGFSTSTPYVLGETFFIPDGGASKESTSWIGLHQITRYCINDKKELKLFYNQHHLLTLNKKKKSFERQLNKTAHLYFVQTRLADRIMAVMNFVRVPSLSMNIVHKHLKEHSFTMPTFTIFEYLHYNSYFEVQRIISKLFGRDNPYLDDARKLFKLPPFKLK